MTIENATNGPWDGDLLSYADYGATFTNLVQSIDGTKVISIEAPFGHGKTFFRTAWAAHLRQQGEVVIEIDAQQSDHSGDPVVTFIGALIAAQEGQPSAKVKSIGKKGLKLAGIASRSVARAILKTGAEEIIEAVGDWTAEQVGDNAAMQGTIEEIEQGMSKVAGQMIASQLAAEHARERELPKQLDALRNALTDKSKTKRVVILIDELDRCHPEYAIALLEAMKLVFGRPGYVFCLMVNADYLESIAHHRFGTKVAGERYLDKFVDLRLTLKPSDVATAEATRKLALTLPLAIPFGEGKAFSVEAAADVASKLAVPSGLSFRQIKRVLEKVELALRCYRDKPLDCPLLVYLAFQEAIPELDRSKKVSQSALPRAGLTPERAAKVREKSEVRLDIRQEEERHFRRNQFIQETCPELVGLEPDRYGVGAPRVGEVWRDWYLVLVGLGPKYVPEHEEVLRSVHSIMAT